MDAMKSAAEVLVSSAQADLWRQLNETTEPAATTPGALLLEVARAHAARPAVIAGQRELTYGELASLSQTVAAQVQADSVVICVEPGWEQVLAVTAALVGGKRFAAVSPGAPQSARWGQLADAPARVVLTQSWLEDRLRWPEGTQRICLDRISPDGDGIGVAAGDPASVACLLPHPVTHDGLATPMTDLIGRFEIGPQDRLLAVCPLGDEVSVSAILMMLLAGGAVIVPDDIDLRTPAVWVDLMLRHRVTVWHSPPALAALLAEHLQQRGDDRPEQLRLVMLGGEPFALSLTGWLRRALGERPRLVNLGPGAGAGIWSACYEFGEADPRRGHLPIGTPLAATRAYILSDALVPCPAWVSGRLHLGGRLLHAAGETVDAMGQALRRTEYSGRLLSREGIELSGEDGTRLSVSGHAFNLRDIEAALATHEDVLLAAAIEAGEGSVAFVKIAPGRPLTGRQLLDHLRTKMSPYLLPERVEPVGSFPLTPAGRIDRAALAAHLTARGGAEPVPAQAAPGVAAGYLIKRASALAAQILDLPDVAPDMNLFDVGATSVQLVRIAVQAETELGIQVDVEELLRFPSISVLVSFAKLESAVAEPAEWERAGVILDPMERVAFKDRRPGVRHELTAEAGVQWRQSTAASGLRDRRTHRHFQTEVAVPESALADLLGHLRRLDDGGEPKYAYPSAGSLYPVQTYLTVNAGRVDGLDEGAYYYHPERHCLVPLTPGAKVDPLSHAWVNRAVARQAAFTLYLVAEQDAIVPMYGTQARDYALIEAGAMCQLLMGAAIGCGLGLCPVGEMDDTVLREPLRLKESHALLHIVLGGVPAEPDPAEAQMLARVSSI